MQLAWLPQREIPVKRFSWMWAFIPYRMRSLWDQRLPDLSIIVVPKSCRSQPDCKQLCVRASNCWRDWRSIRSWRRWRWAARLQAKRSSKYWQFTEENKSVAKAQDTMNTRSFIFWVDTLLPKSIQLKYQLTCRYLQAIRSNFFVELTIFRAPIQGYFNIDI